MSQFYSGQDGVLLVAGSIAGKVRSWSFTANQAVLETTSLGDHNRKLEAGVRSLTGSCSLYYYNDSNNVVSDLLSKVSSTSSTVEMATTTMELRLAKGSTVKTIIMDVFITSYSMNNSQGEISSADVSFEASGEPTTITM